MMLMAVLTGLAFALSTDQVWEDFYISFRHSVNLVEGHGLSYRADQRIQGFSSPLATMLGAGAYAAAGGSARLGFDILRVIGIGSFALGLRWLVNALYRAGTSRGAVTLAALIYCLEIKGVAFSANGMETGFVLALLAGSLDALSRGAEGSPLRMGALWGGLMWARPDSCVYIGLIAMSALAFPSESRRIVARRLLSSGVCCVLAYLPWLLFSWIYYGSPLPLTIVAKHPTGTWPTLSTFIQGLTSLPNLLGILYLPPYAQFGGWDFLRPGSLLLGAVACGWWLCPILSGRRISRFHCQSSLLALGACGYLAALPLTYPWYLPAAVLATLPALAGAFDFVTSWRPRLGWVGVLPVLVLAGLAVDYSLQARVATQVVETQRRTIGVSLAREAAPADRVFLECVGTIGFYANLPMLDWPGLVAPEVIQARKIVGDDMARVGQELEPEWMVLRPEEASHFEEISPGWLRDRYTVVHNFDVTAQLQAQAPRHPELIYDAAFLVLRHR